MLSLVAVGAALAGPLEDGRAAAARGDYAKALARFTLLAHAGDAQAEYELGRLFEGGLGVKADDKAAADWYGKAALAGVHPAQLLLALMYARGQGVAQSDQMGLFWLAKASEDDSPERRQAARLLYVQARGAFADGSPQTSAERASSALQSLQRMAGEGDLHARCALLQLYETGQAAAPKGEDLAATHRLCAEVAAAPSRLPPLDLKLPGAP
jgi:TPR repeat protein